MNNRVKSKEGRLISYACREFLIKFVAQSLPSYAMSVFLLLLDITKDLEGTLSKYWWHSKGDNNKRINLISWARMSKHKSAGGLGFRDFRDFNLAMLGKQGWRFLTNPDSLVSKVYKARYFPGGNFLDAILGNNPIFIWRSI